MSESIPMVTLPESELRRLLEERARLREQVTDLQVRGTELLLENRELARLVKGTQ
jgi:hypothetical protein